MHHALQIQEILTTIFSYCGGSPVDLSSLARTCRAFKEPALDALWERLKDLTPIARCVPEASQWLSKKYSFHRPLTRSEWDILRRYTCRIRSLSCNSDTTKLDKRSLGILSNPHTTEPLFPKLHSLTCGFHIAVHLLRLPLPSLLSIIFTVDRGPLNASGMNDFLQALPQLCPNVRFVCFEPLSPTSLNKAFSSCICGWKNLRDVLCFRVPLDAAAIIHLSRIDGLTSLQFTLDALLPPFDSPLIFTNLDNLVMRSESWSFISQFLSRIQLPATTELVAYIPPCPSRLEFSSFFASVQMSGASSTLESFSLTVDHSWSPDVHPHPSQLLLGLNDLRPCMEFSNLYDIYLDIWWNVGLTDSDLLTLASAWPYLRSLSLNASWGWNEPGGITPNGLLKLLRTCPALDNIALAMDTRGDVAFVPSPESLGPTLPRPFTLRLVHSVIEEESVSSVAAFFASIASLPKFRLYVEQSEWSSLSDQDVSVCECRWNEVYRQAKNEIMQRS